MPQKDFYHDSVRNVLEKDGWNDNARPVHDSIGRREILR